MNNMASGEPSTVSEMWIYFRDMTIDKLTHITYEVSNLKKTSNGSASFLIHSFHMKDGKNMLTTIVASPLY